MSTSKSAKPGQTATDAVSLPTVTGEMFIVDASDAERVKEMRWHLTRCSKNYVRTYAGKGRYIRLHRLILDITDPDVVIDHIDGNTLNNTRANLRACSHAENMLNRGPASHNTLGLKGVYPKGASRFRAIIKSAGKQHYLGSFPTPEEAHAAYVAAIPEHHGEYGRC